MKFYAKKLNFAPARRLSACVDNNTDYGKKIPPEHHRLAAVRLLNAL